MGKCHCDMSPLKYFTMCLIGCVVFYLVNNYYNSANYNGIVIDTCLLDALAEKLTFLNADPNLTSIMSLSAILGDFTSKIC